MPSLAVHRPAAPGARGTERVAVGSLTILVVAGWLAIPGGTRPAHGALRPASPPETGRLSMEAGNPRNLRRSPSPQASARGLAPTLRPTTGPDCAPSRPVQVASSRKPGASARRKNAATPRRTAGRTSMSNAARHPIPPPSADPDDRRPLIAVRNLDDAREVEHLIQVLLELPPERRILAATGYLLGRKYHPETKTRIASQQVKPGRKPEKREATNQKPIPVPFLRSSLQYLDCMTYVEHVLALVNSERPDHAGAFLPRLIDVMFDARGGPLFSHLRLHFTSHWAVVLERKGYLTDVARGHPAARRRSVLLNRVGDNRTFFVEDRFMIASEPQEYWYFPNQTVLEGRSALRSGDIVALACEREGLDVVHMGFYVEHDGRRWLRHASSKLNRIVDQDLAEYLAGREAVIGLMALRPRFAAPTPPGYRFTAAPGR